MAVATIAITGNLAEIGETTGSITEALGTIGAGLEGASAAAYGLMTNPITLAAGIGLLGASLFTNWWNTTRAATVKNVLASNTKAYSAIIPKLEALKKIGYDTLTQDQQLKLDIVDAINPSLRIEITKMLSNYDKFIAEMDKLGIQWLTNIAVAKIAATDNSFYTLNKGDIEALASTSTTEDKYLNYLLSNLANISIFFNNLNDIIDDNFNLVVVSISGTRSLPGVAAPGSEKKVDEILPGIVWPGSDTLGAMNPDALAKAQLALEKMLEALIANGSISLTRTINAEEEEEEEKKKRRKCTPLMAMMGMCTIENENSQGEIDIIIADVSGRSEWLEEIEFVFLVSSPLTSNDKGIVTIKLKDGNVYRIGVFARGRFSALVVEMQGAGYGYWRNLNFKGLKNPETISYNLPKPTLTRQIASIQKELLIPGIIYK